MLPCQWFDDLQVLGELSPSDAAKKLYEVGDYISAQALEKSLEDEEVVISDSRVIWPFQDRPWQHTSHSLGYIPAGDFQESIIPVRSAASIKPDIGLKGSRIKVTLNSLRIASYPGGGSHQILFDFYAQNQLAGVTEDIHFNSAYKVREGEKAAIINYPIFIGLHVGNNGVQLKCLTVNVKNEEDERAIKFLDSSTFRAGLILANTIQPAIKPLSEMAISLTKSIAGRSRNTVVQDIQIGLDFTSNPMGARLAEGVYIAVQIPETNQHVWDWGDWIYDRHTGHIVKDYARDQLIPYNYVAFGISQYHT